MRQMDIQREVFTLDHSLKSQTDLTKLITPERRLRNKSAKLPPSGSSEHGSDFSDCERWRPEMGDAMAIRAQDYQILEASFANTIKHRQW